jgi:hypothetical protein
MRLPMRAFPFGTTSVPGNTVATISKRPQVIFRPRRLVYGGPAETFEILDVQIGRRSQWLDRGGISADCFPAYPDYLRELLGVGAEMEMTTRYFELVDKLDNFRCDVIQVMLDFTIVIRNRQPHTAEFSCVVFGEFLDEDFAYYNHEPRDSLPVARSESRILVPDPLANYDLAPNLPGRHVVCSWCKGTGGTAGGLCDSCKGTGRRRGVGVSVVDGNEKRPDGMDGSLYFLHPCPVCDGTGGEAGLCSSCKGAGSVKRWPGREVA